MLRPSERVSDVDGSPVTGPAQEEAPEDAPSMRGRSICLRLDTDSSKMTGSRDVRGGEEALLKL